MNTLQTMLVIAMALLGFPAGKFIAHHTPEELKSGRNWFLAIIFISVLGIIASVILADGENLIFLISSFIFVLLVALASVKK